MRQRLKNLKRIHEIFQRMNNQDIYGRWMTQITAESNLPELAEDVDEYDDCISIAVVLLYEYFCG